MNITKLSEGQRVSYTHIEDQGGPMFGSLPPDGELGTVIVTSDTLARIHFDNGTEAAFDRIGDPRLTAVNQLVLNLDSWTRLAEVDEYAARNKLDRASAIRALVNHALSV